MAYSSHPLRKKTRWYIFIFLRWPLFCYLHHNSQFLIITFVHWPQLSEYWRVSINGYFWPRLPFNQFEVRLKGNNRPEWPIFKNISGFMCAIQMSIIQFLLLFLIWQKFWQDQSFCYDLKNIIFNFCNSCHHLLIVRNFKNARFVINPFLSKNKEKSWFVVQLNYSNQLKLDTFFNIGGFWWPLLLITHYNDFSMVTSYYRCTHILLIFLSISFIDGVDHL